MKELFIKFVVGGTVVSFFAVLGDLLKPQELRRTSWSRAFGRSCHTFPCCSERWEGLRTNRISFHDRRRDCLLYLRFVGESSAGQAQASGACRYRFVDPHMDGCRLRALVRSLEISQ